jgi:hypothetical protein
MTWLSSIFSGVKAFVRETAAIAAEALGTILVEFDRSTIGRASAQFIQGATQRYFRNAIDLVEEERELARKYQTDGRRTDEDIERLAEITAERNELRRELEAAQSREAAQNLERQKDHVIAATISDDDASASVGIIATRICSCGATMRLNQRGFNTGSNRRYFFWVCTSFRGTCKNIAFDPQVDDAKVIRESDPNFDMSLNERRAIWTRKDVLVESAGRIRQSLGDSDEAIVCPVHLTPMKLLETNRANGTLLSTYEYVCRGVDSEGRACSHRIPLETFPQVSEALRRRDGYGIIRS